MTEIKKIYHRYDDAAGFDAAVTESLEEGWLLVRCCIARGYDIGTASWGPCWVAELMREARK